MNINTNLSSLIVQSNLSKSTFGLSQAIERMTTGFKLNHAKDNAAGYSISTNMTTKIGAYEVAESNASMGLAMLNTASSALDLISDKLSRLRALTVQAQNGTYGEDSVSAMTKEANSLVSEITRITDTTEYNGIKVFGEKQPVTINGQEVKLNSDGFMIDVVKRDTSTMTRVADLDPTQTITSGTYSISTKEELMKLSERTVGASRLQGGEFVLANDIDMSGVDWHYIENFTGTFDGNGYTVSNLSNGLFGTITNSEIKNLGLKDVKLTAEDNMVSPLGFEVVDSNISNCYATGEVRGESYFFGGLVTGLAGGSIDSCWTDVDIDGISFANSGIAGFIEDSVISNCFSLGDVLNNYEYESSGTLTYGYSGGIVGFGGGTISNCYTSSRVSSLGGTDYENIIASNSGELSLTGSTYDLTITNVTYDAGVNSGMSEYGGVLDRITTNGITSLDNKSQDITLQVGINSGASSCISFSTSFSLKGLSANIDSPATLDKLDEMLKTVSQKQTEFGAVQNRLESVLEEISIQYENLISSRSTIRDADIAEESSEYIKMQILQQASATLLATANQTPALARQLL